MARVRARPRASTSSKSANLPPLIVEITAVFQLDCMIAGIVPHPQLLSTYQLEASSVAPMKAPVHSLTSLLIIAYSPPDTSFLHGNEMTSDRAQQARKASERPELRIISRAGEEIAADAISFTDFQSWGCNDYVLADVDDGSMGVEGRCYVVLSPKDIIIVKPRDRRDHVKWLVERKRYEEALTEVERINAIEGEGSMQGEDAINASDIGQRYIEHLVSEGQ